MLDVGHNALSGRLMITGLPSLRALMLNGNQLTCIEGTTHTLVQIELQPSHSSKLHGMIAHLNASEMLLSYHLSYAYSHAHKIASLNMNCKQQRGTQNIVLLSVIDR